MWERLDLMEARVAVSVIYSESILFIDQLIDIKIPNRLFA